MKAMCKINRNPIAVGSIIRDTCWSTRLLIVTDIQYGNLRGVDCQVVAMETYGKIAYGKFYPSIRPQSTLGTFRLVQDTKVGEIMSDKIQPSDGNILSSYWRMFGNGYQHITCHWTKRQVCTTKGAHSKKIKQMAEIRAVELEKRIADIHAIANLQGQLASRN